MYRLVKANVMLKKLYESRLMNKTLYFRLDRYLHIILTSQ